MKKLLLLLLLASAAFLAGADYNAEGKRWWAHIENLANDSMEGRNTGSPGHLKAARYIANEFERAGLKPAGTGGGYLQPVEFDVKQLDERNSQVMLVRHGAMEPLTLGEDANLSSRGVEGDGDINAAAVFVGYGLTVPEKSYDDLAGLDLKGKIAVMLAGGPKMASALRAHYSSAGERWKFLKAAGVIGIVTIPNPKSMDIPWSRQALARTMPSMVLSDPSLIETQGQRFLMTFNPERADKLFADTGHTIAELLDDADHNRPLPHFPLKVAIRAHTTLQQSKVESQNVVAVLRGTDLKDEYVVLSAHLDHVGVGQPINGDSIYNGAMDDASGIATILEVARHMHDSHVKLRRSVLFLAVTGEEKGLQGSKYFAAHPTVTGDLVADINLDMFLPLHALRYLEVQGLDESTLGDDIRAIAAAAHVEVQADKEPNRNLFIRSDQYNFIRKGVPSLAFKFGYLPGSPEEKLHKDWLKNRYHAPSDDLNQPVDKAAAARFNEIILKLAERVASSDKRPVWKPNSFFRRFAD